MRKLKQSRTKVYSIINDITKLKGNWLPRNFVGHNFMVDLLTLKHGTLFRVKIMSTDFCDFGLKVFSRHGSFCMRCWRLHSGSSRLSRSAWPALLSPSFFFVAKGENQKRKKTGKKTPLKTKLCNGKGLSPQILNFTIGNRPSHPF